MNRLAKLYLYTIYLLPPLLFFSYYPVIPLGMTNTMNLELSLPLCWLVFFDLLSLVLFIKFPPHLKNRRLLLTLLFPIFLTLSIFWSKNPLRAFLTVGILWSIYFAIFSFFTLPRHFIKKPIFHSTIIKSFLISSVIFSIWCWLQALLDLFGVSPNLTLICPGCTTETFGFPHPNGFAIEPQFMGNLLIAPAIYAIYRFLKSPTRTFTLLAFFLSASLLFTFSRGAIYAFIIALTFLIVVSVFKKDFISQKTPFIIFAPICLIFGAFLFTLNAQGLFSAFSSTNDNYLSGIAKSLHHLSLGHCDLTKQFPPSLPSNQESLPPNQTPSPSNTTSPSKTSVFTGYVPASTNIRLELSRSALLVWQQTPTTILWGTGLGSAGIALYEQHQTSSPKEIVQNEYLSLLLETGLIGIILLLITLTVVISSIKSSASFILLITLFLAYSLSFLFFSGLPNALHIFLFPPLLYNSKRKKLVG